MGFEILLFISSILTITQLIALILSVPIVIRREEARARPNYEPTVTVIVPTHNEERVIERCIRSILRGDYPSDRLQTIIVDDDSTDKTRAIVEKYKMNGVKLVARDTKSTKGSALNSVRELVEGEVIAILDADCCLEEESIKSAVSNFLDPKIGGVLGLPKPINIRQNWLTRALAIGDFLRFFTETVWNLYGASSLLVGECMFIRRRLMDEWGWFDDDVLLEDAYASMMILDLGFRIRLVRHAVVWCEQPYDFWVYLKQRRRWFRGAFQLMRKIRSRGPHGIRGLKTVLARTMQVYPYYAPLFTFVLLILFLSSYPLSPSIITIISFVGLITSLLIISEPFIIYKEWKREFTHIPLWILISVFTLVIMVPLALLDEVFRKPVVFYKRPKRGVISH